MPHFSQTSLDRLNTCDPRLVKLFTEVIKHVNCTVICGHRSQEEQDRAVTEGKSKTPYPQSKHNPNPALAADVAPYIQGKGISWDRSHCCYFAGMVMAIASYLSIPLRWGGDWDRDGEVITDQTFQDLVHFELAD